MMGLFNIGCSGLRCILKAWANSPHITVASCLQVWKSLRIREGGGFPRAIHICSSESSNWKGCVSIRRVRTGICWRTWGRWARPVTLGIGWLCACRLQVWIRRQVGTVGTACLGNVSGLLDHVGSAGGKVCSRSSSQFGSWAFPAGILRFGGSGMGQVYTDSCPRCRCWDASVHMLLTDLNSDWRCCIHCVAHSFSRIFLYDFSRFCGLACCNDGGIGVCGSILSLSTWHIALCILLLIVSSCMMARACCSLTYSVCGMMFFWFVFRRYLNWASCRFCVIWRGGMPTSASRAMARP